MEKWQKNKYFLFLKSPKTSLRLVLAQWKTQPISIKNHGNRFEVKNVNHYHHILISNGEIQFSEYGIYIFTEMSYPLTNLSLKWKLHILDFTKTCWRLITLTLKSLFWNEIFWELQYFFDFKLNVNNLIFLNQKNYSSQFSDFQPKI